MHWDTRRDAERVAAADGLLAVEPSRSSNDQGVASTLGEWIDDGLVTAPSDVSSSDPSSPEWAPGERLASPLGGAEGSPMVGRYEDLGLLGVGGMGRNMSSRRGCHEAG